MSRRSTLLLVFVCTILVVGILLAGPAKRRLIEEIIGLLEDEVRASCDCTLEYDDATLSFLFLKAGIKGAKILEKGKEKLRIKRIETEVSLRDITKREIALSHILLQGVHADGVGDKSVIFRFIEQLTAPLPPEKNIPGRWKVKLISLTIEPGSFIEEFTRSALVAEGVRLFVRRVGEDFELIPSIETLSVRYPRPELSKQIVLGNVRGRLTIKDDYVDWQQVKLTLQNAWAEIQGVSDSKQRNRLKGTLAFAFDDASLRLNRYFHGHFQGSGKLAGTLGSPKFSGMFALKDSPLQLLLSSIPVLEFLEAEGQYSFDLNKGTPLLTIPSVQASKVGAVLHPSSSFRMVDDAFHGGFDLHVQRIEAGPFAVDGVQMRIELDGTFDRFTTTVKAEVDEVQFLKHAVGPGSITASYVDDGLTFSVNTRDVKDITFKGDGFLSLAGDGPPNLERFDYTMSGLTLFSLTGDSPVNDINLTGQGSLTGPTSLQSLRGETRFKALYKTPNMSEDATLDFRGTATLHDGMLKLDAKDITERISPRAWIDLLERENSRITVSLDQYSPHGSHANCAEVSLSSEYFFQLDRLLNGDGEMNLRTARYGCSPYMITLGTPKSLAIKDGKLSVAGVTATGGATGLAIEGGISVTEGYTLAAKGEVRLESFLHLIPAIDQMSGTVGIALSIKGPLESPAVYGTASLKDAELSDESLGLNATDMEGSLELMDNKISIGSLTGGLNTGDFILSGMIDPANLSSSALQLQLNDVLLEPSPSIFLVSSGKLHLKTSESFTPKIEGALEVKNASFERNIDIRTIVDALSRMILPRDDTESRPSTGQGPDIELDLHLAAPRNLFVITNWIEAELKADLRVTGKVQAPRIEGKMETLSGWFGLRDRRFDVISGTLDFKPRSRLPILDVVSEATLTTRTGEDIGVILEASGPLNAPRLTFSSDRGLSQREILSLLTSTEDRAGPKNIRRYGFGLQYEDLSLIDRETPFFGDTLLYQITRIDSISLEPTFNSLTGSVEPTVTAEKWITDDLSLVGEGLFSGALTESEARLQYSLSNNLILSGSVESVSIRPQAAFGIDLAYTVLSSHAEYLQIEIIGNEDFSRAEILEFVKLKETSRIPATEMGPISRTIEQAYEERGYFEARAAVTCAETTGDCRSMRIDIAEGEPSRVDSIDLEGEGLQSLFSVEDLDRLKRRANATKRFLSSTRDRIIRKLRNEGYISARVKARYEPVPDSDRRRLVVTIDPGRPVTFFFEGNQRFSAEELLESIDLFGRRQPFGNNSIAVLVARVEAKYREAGYLFATISHTRQENPSGGRTHYLITIDEGPQAPVQEVSFEGNTTLSTKKLKRLIKAQDPLREESIFYPSYAVEEELRANSEAIRAAYHEEGFPSATVQFILTPADTGDSVGIQYKIIEGERINARALEVQGYPEAINVPDQPLAPYSIPKANRYLDLVIDSLREQGFRTPYVWTSYDPSDDLMRVHVEPGPTLVIGEIEVQGNVNIEQSVIREQISVTENSPWNTLELSESKRRLLKLGLFSRVELVPRDGELSSEREDLLIKVIERPLRSLKIGGGLNSQYGVHVFGEATDRKLFRDGRAFSLKVDTYYEPSLQEISQGSANLLFTHPRILNSDFTLVEDLRFQKISTITQEFDVERTSLASYVYHSFENGITTSLGHTFSSENLTDVSPDAILSELDEGHVKLSFLSGETTYDRRDDPLNPRSGFTVGVDYKLASTELGSDADFYSLGGRVSVLYPLGGAARRFTIAALSRIAAAEPFGDTREIPITQRFYLGGRTSVRGFRENSLGPRGEEGNTIGGDLLQTNTLQLQYLVAQNTSVHTFIDTGNVFLNDKTTSIFDQRVSTGIGIHYLSPIGPIGFDIGRPLNERSGEPSMRFHFSVGTNF